MTQEPQITALPESALEPHPCLTEDGSFDHEWEFQDDSFDHEFGTEVVHYWECQRCGETKAMEPGDYECDFDY
jgi:hypothetical protein